MSRPGWVEGLGVRGGDRLPGWDNVLGGRDQPQVPRRRKQLQVRRAECQVEPGRFETSLTDGPSWRRPRAPSARFARWASAPRNAQYTSSTATQAKRDLLPTLNSDALRYFGQRYLNLVILDGNFDTHQTLVVVFLKKNNPLICITA